MARWRLSCDTCGFEARIGEGEGWCEACQRATPLTVADPASARCPACGGPLAGDIFPFEELYGGIQNAAAVLAAWAGDPAPLAALLPDRPRFLTDLDPPEIVADDDGAVRTALHRLRQGSFADARQRLEERLEEGPGPARLWRALAVARERGGDLPGAEAACARALEAAEDPRVRLMRGALRARRADFEGAREDLDRAGDTHEARWNRAALTVLEAVVRTPGLPDPAALGRARAQAGERSDYWSEPTVGRLLWTLLVERARSRARRGAPECPDERVLRAAEGELEFDTFWDRALVVHGYAALGMERERARTAAPLAGALLEALAAEPALAHPAAREIRAGVDRAADLARAGDPAAALAATRALMERDDLRRYRVPCGACERGSIGVEALEEETGEAVGEDAAGALNPPGIEREG